MRYLKIAFREMGKKMLRAFFGFIGLWLMMVALALLTRMLPVWLPIIIPVMKYIYMGTGLIWIAMGIIILYLIEKEPKTQD
jgi:hypothetical protein